MASLFQRQVRDFQRRLDAIPQEIRAAVLPAIRTSAEELATEMRNRVPVDTGALRGSITVTPPGQSTPAHSQPGGSRVAGPLEVLVTAGNTRARHGAHVEFGTVNSEASPFFFVSYRLLRKRLNSRINRAINRAVKEAWKSP